MANFIEFPVFDGVSGDLRQWIAWLEDFFVRERFTEDEKMNLAQSLLEGEANAWFYSSRERFAFQSWEHLVVELLIWRFGVFGDGGVFSDLELFLFWNKYDRISRKQRRKRMETTSLNLQESISSMSTITEKITVEKSSNQQKIIEEFSENVAEILDERASEKKLIPQCQVPNSSLEPSLSFSCESLVVSEASAKESIEKDESHEAKMVKVENETAMFHNLAGISSAYQVFDKKSPHKERLKSKPKRKLSLSPKTWMFKFKNKNLQRQYSCSRATFGYKWKEHNSRYWRRIRQTHLSRLLCISQTNVEKALEALKEIQSQQATVMRDGTKVSSLPAKELVPGDIVELRVGDKLQFLCEKVSIVSCLSLDAQFKSLEVVMVVLKVHHSLRNTRFTSSEMKQFVGFMMFQLKHKWRSKHLHTISAWEFYLSSVFPTVTSANSCSGYKRMHEQLQVHTILIVNDVKSQVKHKWRLVWRLWRLHNQWFVLVILQLREPYGWSGARGLGQLILDDLKLHMRHRWKSKLLLHSGFDGNNTRLTVWRVLCLLGTLFWSTSFKKQKFSKNWWYKFKHSLWQRECGRELLEADVLVPETSLILQLYRQLSVVLRLNQKLAATYFDPFQVLERIGMVAYWLCLHDVSKIHAVFHVSHLKTMIGDHPKVQTSALAEMLEEELLVPETIVDIRFDDVGRRELLIQWQDRNHSENSWMFSKAFVNLYPSFKLEDKLGLQGGSIDTIHQSFYRKKKRELAVKADDLVECSNSKEASR